MRDYNLFGTKYLGVFTPRRTHDLKPGMAELIGREFQWTYADSGADDEAYPGQRRWWIAREQVELLGESASYWVPEEDIAWTVPPPPPLGS